MVKYFFVLIFKLMESHRTILSIVFGFLLLNLFIDSKYLYYLILFVSGISLLSVKTSLLIENYWFKLSSIGSKVFPNILLILVYIFILTPLSFLSKMFYSKTEFKSKNQTKSVFENTNRSITKDSFNRGW